MTCADAAVLAFDVGDRRSFRFDTIEEVAHVIDDRIQLARAFGAGGVVEVVDGEGLSWERLLLKVFDRFARDGSSVYEDASLGAGEHDAVATIVFDCHHHAVAVGVLRFEIDGDVETIRTGFRVLRCCFDLNRQVIDGPLADVDVVCSPVGHLPAGVFVPPAECVVRSLGDERHVGRLALPHVPVEVRWNRMSFERSADFVLAENHIDSLEFTESSRPNDFDGETKSRVAALPRTDLYDTFGFFDDFEQLLALVDRKCQRFFAVHIFARAAGVDDHLCVPMIGRADDDDIDVLAFQHVAIVFECLPVCCRMKPLPDRERVCQRRRRQ